MPDISQHSSLSKANILGIGDSGTGKTGSLISLVEAGFNLRILDTDKGVDIISQIIRSKGITLRPGQVQFETIEDKMKVMPTVGQLYGDGTGFFKALKLLEKWSDDSKPSEWGPDTVLVIDSWSGLSTLSMSSTLRIANWLGNRPRIDHWGSAIDDLRDVLNVVLSSTFKCQVIIFSHVTYIGMASTPGSEDAKVTKSLLDQGLMQAYPNALGTKLPAEMGRYFNNVIGYKVSGSGASAKRSIETVPQLSGLALKTSSPFTVKKSYPQETGLLELFTDLGIKSPAKE